ncbi:MAG TPA: YezD family protein [Bacillota bacterium]|nr:YezD family protein [Bacillota bacterium]
MGKKKENFNHSIESLQNILETMNYGSITLIVQDNYVVQIERNEKVRLK